MKKPSYKRLFSLDEANRSLSSVRHTVCKIYQMNNLLQSLLREMRITSTSDLSLDAFDTENNLDNISSIKILLAGITEEMETIKNSGCIFKSLEQGIVEWPTLKNDSVVYFRWHVGNQNIGRWVDPEVEQSFPIEQFNESALDTEPSHHSQQ